MIAIYEHPARLEFKASIVIPGKSYRTRPPDAFDRPRIVVAHHRIFVHVGPTRVIAVYDFNGKHVTSIPNGRQPRHFTRIIKWVVTKSRVILHTSGSDTPTWVTTLDGQIMGRSLLTDTFKASTTSDIVIDPYQEYRPYLDVTRPCSMTGYIGRPCRASTTSLDTFRGYHVFIDDYHIAINESEGSREFTNIRTSQIGEARSFEWISIHARFGDMTRAGEFVLLHEQKQVQVFRLVTGIRFTDRVRVILDRTTLKRTVARGHPIDFDPAAFQRVAVIPTEGPMGWSPHENRVDGFASITSDSELWCLRNTDKGPMLHRYFRGFQHDP
jgi:hypothetical protein